MGRQAGRHSLRHAGFARSVHGRRTATADDFFNIILLQQPEVYISRVHELLDEDGKLVNESTRDFLKSFIEAFEKFAAAIVAIK